MRSAYTRFAAGLALGLAVVVAAQSAEVVVLKDGFMIQGNVRKETESLRDPFAKGVMVLKADGFDYVDDGPRMTIFSSHYKQLGEVSKDIRLRPDYRAFSNPITYRKNNQLPFMTGIREMPEFNEKWRRTLKVNLPGNDWDKIDQQITYLDPYCCYIVSSSHVWTQSFRTVELGPKTVRKLLSMHPELAEKDGKVDPARRIAIARFLKDAGWLYESKTELENLKKLAAGPYDKDPQDQYEKLLKEIDTSAAELVVNEAEFAVNAGRYQHASEMLALFPEKSADAKVVDRATKLMAQVKTAREQYETGRKHLRILIDDALGSGAVRPFIAAGGGPVVAVLPVKAANPQLVALATAAEEVYSELHPDTVGRIEFFVNLAAQVEREKGMGQPPTKKPEELLATAISGWAKGKNGATPNYDLALRLWAARQMILDYQRGGSLNERNNVLNAYKKLPNPIGLDELTQVISLVPPAEPENLDDRTGTLVKGSGLPDGIYRRRSAPFGSHPAGLDYFVKLPPEYQHGRAYPVIVACTQPSLPAEHFIASIAAEADRHGYIVIAPDWAPTFSGKASTWSWDGADHDYVTGALRDTIRHFTVDTDRVFLLGGGPGADMAMDVGISHPDLFAGVVAVGPNPKWGSFFMHYWRNGQKLPFYVVSGEMAGEANAALRQIYAPWVRHGFPSLQVLYRGRAFEWYPAEVPVIFDWLGRKKRITTTASMRLGGTGEPIRWQIMRETDNHFYWLGAERVHPGNLSPDNKPNPNLTKVADLTGDIQGDLIAIKSQGVRQISIYLGRDMINWSRPVRVSINRNLAPGWKTGGKMIEQDINVLMEDYYQRGDRRMLFLARLEFTNPD
jgi:hypothetical protein